MPRTKFEMGKVGLEIKKSRLLKHLDEIEKLGREWVRELYASDPFGVSSIPFDPSSPGYRPDVERDEDTNHMLRRHFRSRQLWKNHTEWEEKLRAIARIRGGLLERFGRRVNGGDFTDAFLNTALEDAFDQVLNRTLSFNFELGNGGTSVVYRARMIVKSDRPVDLDSIRNSQNKLGEEIAASKEMAEAVEIWGEAMTLQEGMVGLVRTALRASDLMYPCRYCKHLWKD